MHIGVVLKIDLNLKTIDTYHIPTGCLSFYIKSYRYTMATYQLNYAAMIRKNLSALQHIVEKSSDPKKVYKMRSYEEAYRNLPLYVYTESDLEIIDGNKVKFVAGTHIMAKIKAIMTTQKDLEEVVQYYMELDDDEEDDDDDEDDDEEYDEEDEDDDEYDDEDDIEVKEEVELLQRPQRIAYIQNINEIENYMYLLDTTQPEVKNILKELSNLKLKYTNTFY